MQNLFYVIDKGARAAAKGSLRAVASRLIKYRHRQNFLQPPTRSTGDLLLPLRPNCIFSKDQTSPIPHLPRSGWNYFTRRSLYLGFPFLLFPSPFPRASRLPTRRRSCQPRCRHTRTSGSPDESSAGKETSRVLQNLARRLFSFRSWRVNL